jgi:high mobility group protein B1
MLVCQWKSAESKAVVAAALAEGKTFHPFSGEAKKKSRSGSSKKSARKPRAKKSKKAIRSSVPRAKNPFMFFLAEKRPEIRAKLVADAEANPVMETNEAGEQVAVVQKVPVSAVAKIAGEIWRDLSEEDKAPYVAKADASKAEREAKIAEMEEELNSLADDNSTIATQEEPSTPVSEADEVVMPPPAPKKATVTKKVTAATLPKISQFDLSDPITAACFKGVDDAGNVHPTSESVSDAEDDEMSAVTEATGEVEELDGADEEGEEVEEHTLADGTDVLKGADGTIYDPESYEPLGKWNKADNTLVEA